MLVVMQADATEEQVRAVCQRIESLGLRPHPIPGAARTAIGITGNSGEVDTGALESMPGVVECIPVSKPYKLVSRDVKAENSVVRVPTPSGDVTFGGQGCRDRRRPVRGRNARAGVHHRRNAFARQECAFFAAALTNHARLPTAFRGSAKTA